MFPKYNNILPEPMRVPAVIEGLEALIDYNKGDKKTALADKFITIVGEKTHGFNRKDDSPQWL